MPSSDTLQQYKHQLEGIKAQMQNNKQAEMHKLRSELVQLDAQIQRLLAPHMRWKQQYDAAMAEAQARGASAAIGPSGQPQQMQAQVVVSEEQIEQQMRHLQEIQALQNRTDALQKTLDELNRW